MKVYWPFKKKIKISIDSTRSQELKQIMLDALNQADNGGE